MVRLQVFRFLELYFRDLVDTIAPNAEADISGLRNGPYVLSQLFLRLLRPQTRARARPYSM